ncbi:MAG: type II toxin-antitoxin system VapC family toxin [Rhodococcus sp. (in: high G+C Gram-positive bacteria)]|nr:type II toxin-antitoxin system VapC family toxin [Rhodococcus sp. (in: high G+C Gram-positive bacteria)]MDI6627702.1 type II toxin-antitoxin system VapC family toxin [Rhodococcus sp. (in: high G+C Gram-positive bacteria)]
MAAMRTVLDTSVLIGDSLDRVAGEVAISAISLAGLHFGVLVASTSEQRALRLQRLVAVERRFEPLAVDAKVARSYGRLAAAVRESGRRPQARALTAPLVVPQAPLLLMIAATAHAHGARLMTRNAEDLRGIEELVEIHSP